MDVNPVTNKIYVANAADDTVTVIDGTSNATATVSVGTNPRALAVNPVTNKIYVANFGAASVTVIDGATNTSATVTAAASPISVAVNRVTNNIYVANESGTVTVIDGATNATTPVTAGTLPFSVAVNEISNKIYVANLNGGNVTVIDGATNATSTVTAGLKPAGVAVNPVTNKIYVANRGDAINSITGTVTVIDGASSAKATVTVGLSPVPVAVGPVTNKIYVVDEDSDDVTVIDEQQDQAVPLVTTITPLGGNTTSSATPTFTFSAASSFAPTAPPVTKLYFQFDTWQGPWIAATGGPATFSGTAPVLSTGTHILYAFATDGQDATSTITGSGSSPLTGIITAYLFDDRQPAQLPPPS